jgi:arylsulfatase A-like enzyme
MWLAAGASIASADDAGPNKAKADRPNVLFIAIDDLRPELGCFGASHIHSPNIDRLAQSGVLFRRAYCQVAVCGATRTSLLTGMRPDTSGVYGNRIYFRKPFPNVVTLPQHFKQQGYHVLGMGKIYHHNDRPSWSQPWTGFSALVWHRPENEQLVARLTQEANAKGLKGYARSRACRGPPFEAADVPDEAYADGECARLAVDTLRKIKDRQFFLAVGFFRPHLPFNSPKKYWDLYEADDIELPDYRKPPKGAPPYALTSWGELRSYHGVPPKGPVTEAMAKKLIHGYYASVSYADACAGRVIDELDRLGLRDNTIVVLWGDHGWKLADYNCWCKHTNFELDTHVPLIIDAPGAAGNGQPCDRLVEFLDIYPTLCDLADLPVPEHAEGQSLATWLENPEASGKPAAFSQYPRGSIMGRSMRTDRYRLTLWTSRKDGAEVKAVELYDHQTDPGETVNLAVDPKHKQTVERLTKQIRRQWPGGIR